MSIQIIRKTACARAGVIGNPSDGYFGKTISVILPAYFARVTVYEWEELEIVMRENNNRFRSIDDLVRDVRQHGYYKVQHAGHSRQRFFRSEYQLPHQLCRHRRNPLPRRRNAVPGGEGEIG